LSANHFCTKRDSFGQTETTVRQIKDRSPFFCCILREAKIWQRTIEKPIWKWLLETILLMKTRGVKCGSRISGA